MTDDRRSGRASTVYCRTLCVVRNGPHLIHQFLDNNLTAWRCSGRSDRVKITAAPFVLSSGDRPSINNIRSRTLWQRATDAGESFPSGCLKRGVCQCYLARSPREAGTKCIQSGFAQHSPFVPEKQVARILTKARSANQTALVNRFPPPVLTKVLEVTGT